MITVTEPPADTSISRIDRHRRSNGYPSTHGSVGERLSHFTCNTACRPRARGSYPHSKFSSGFTLRAHCLLSIFQYHNIFEKEDLSVSRAMPSWILLAYPFLMVGPPATVLDNSQTRSSGLPIFIGGLMFEGLGRSVVFIMYTVDSARLARSRLPEVSKRPGVFVAVGLAGYTSATLAALGMEAPRVNPPDLLSIHSDVRTGDLCKAFAIRDATFIWLLGFSFSPLPSVLAYVAPAA
ncbi:hypothetical protein DL767_007776 [Monosporascus sp. MG133]|nr:hypothetical protein DL767_007776 [Monosporascus sp. MG133]